MTSAEIAQQLANLSDEVWADLADSVEGEEIAKTLERVLEEYCLLKNIAPPDDA